MKMANKKKDSKNDNRFILILCIGFFILSLLLVTEPIDFVVLIMLFIAAVACLAGIIPKSKKNGSPRRIPINIISTLIFFGAFIIFGSIGLYCIYSLIKGEIDTGSLLGSIIGCIVARIIGNSFIHKLKEHLRIAIAKKNVKKGKMIPAQMTIIGFKFSGEVMGNDYYQIICSDGERELYSEEMLGDISGFHKESFEYLESLKIIYNPKNPQETLDKLNNSEFKASKMDRIIINITKIIGKLNPGNSYKKINYGEITNTLERYINGLYEETVSRLNKQIKQGDKYKQPSLTFNGIKIHVGDSLNVYINPNNKKSYLVDIYCFYE